MLSISSTHIIQHLFKFVNFLNYFYPPSTSIAILTISPFLHKKTLDSGNPLMMGCLLSRDGLLLICVKYTSFKSVLSKLN
nr:MAG TPA: hypothetical protein [Bacteriophage sp.]